MQKLKVPTTVKGCRSFAGMVNFLSLFCLELQNILMYNIPLPINQYSSNNAISKTMNIFGFPMVISSDL